MKAIQLLNTITLISLLMIALLSTSCEKNFTIIDENELPFASAPQSNEHIDDTLNSEIDHSISQNSVLPDEFPIDEIPLCDNADLIMVQEILYEENRKSFTLLYVSNGNYIDIRDYLINALKNLYGNHILVNDMNVFTTISGESPNYTYSITIAQTKNEDYSLELQFIVDAK